MTGKSPSILNALIKSFADMEIKPQDHAAVALAKRLAATMDNAQAVADEYDGIRFEEIKGNMWKRLERVEAKVRAETVVNDLAPKLLAVLVQCGMTPAARAAVAKGGVPNVAVNSGPADALAALRAKRAAG